MELLSDIHKAGNTVLMVTHNPSLTKYANRVVFMHDGAIVADEQTALVEIPTALRRSMYFMPKRTVDDDLAGVSTLMQSMQDKEEPAKPKKTTKKAPKKRTYKTRKKTKGSK